jgi:hypothetical protein
MLSDLGRREEALAATQEAVGHYRTLAQARPDAFLPDLASSLMVHAFVVAKGDPGRAAASAREALGIYTPLVRQLPAVFATQFRITLKRAVEWSTAAGLDSATDPVVLEAIQAGAALGLTGKGN